LCMLLKNKKKGWKKEDVACNCSIIRLEKLKSVWQVVTEKQQMRKNIKAGYKLLLLEEERVKAKKNRRRIPDKNVKDLEVLHLRR